MQDENNVNEELVIEYELSENEKVDDFLMDALENLLPTPVLIELIKQDSETLLKEGIIYDDKQSA